MCRNLITDTALLVGVPATVNINRKYWHTCTSRVKRILSFHVELKNNKKYAITIDFLLIHSKLTSSGNGFRGTTLKFEDIQIHK